MNFSSYFVESLIPDQTDYLGVVPRYSQMMSLAVQRWWGNTEQ